jgi:hypothetical protein
VEQRQNRQQWQALFFFFYSGAIHRVFIPCHRWPTNLTKYFELHLASALVYLSSAQRQALLQAASRVNAL